MIASLLAKTAHGVTDVGLDIAVLLWRSAPPPDIIPNAGDDDTVAHIAGSTVAAPPAWARIEVFSPAPRDWFGGEVPIAVPNWTLDFAKPMAGGASFAGAECSHMAASLSPMFGAAHGGWLPRARAACWNMGARPAGLRTRSKHGEPGAA